MEDGGPSFIQSPSPNLLGNFPQHVSFLLIIESFLTNESRRLYSDLARPLVISSETPVLQGIDTLSVFRENQIHPKVPLALGLELSNNFLQVFSIAYSNMVATSQPHVVFRHLICSQDS